MKTKPLHLRMFTDKIQVVNSYLRSVMWTLNIRTYILFWCILENLNINKNVSFGKIIDFKVAIILIKVDFLQTFWICKIASRCFLVRWNGFEFREHIYSHNCSSQNTFDGSYVEVVRESKTIHGVRLHSNNSHYRIRIPHGYISSLGIMRHSLCWTRNRTVT